MTKEVMQQALEALRMPCEFWNKTQFIKVTEAIKALEEALKQEQGEPVAMRYDYDGYGYKYIDSGSGSDWQTRIKDAEPMYTAPPAQPAQEPVNQFNPDWDAMAVMVEEQQRMAKRIEELEAELAKQEQDEPVAWLEENSAKAMSDLEKQAWIQAGRDELVKTYNRPLYTKPQTKEWADLSVDDIEDIAEQFHDIDYDINENPYDIFDHMGYALALQAKLKEKNS